MPHDNPWTIVGLGVALAIILFVSLLASHLQAKAIMDGKNREWGPL